MACLIQVDRWENMRRIQPARLLAHIARRVIARARDYFKLSLSMALLQEAQAPDSERSSPDALVRRMLDEVARVSEQGRVTLLLDGLEKVPQGPGLLELLDALAALPEAVDLVVVIPRHLAFGRFFGPGAAEAVLRTGERLVPARAWVVDGPQGETGCERMQQMLLRRLQLTPADFSPRICRTPASMWLTRFAACCCPGMPALPRPPSASTAGSSS